MSTTVCLICPHSCQLRPGETGICGARQGQVARVVSRNYGECTSLALDPITKKPLAHFYPKAKVLSYGSYGCNLSCQFCQNWEIAQIARPSGNKEGTSQNRDMAPPSRRAPQSDVRESAALLNTAIERVVREHITPRDLVEEAVALRPKGNIGIALTYNEPLVSPEYLVDVAEQAHAQNLKVVVVTNGYVMPDVARQVFSVVDAANIDLKAFNQSFYTMVGAPAGLYTVKRSIQIAYEAGCHVEVTTLIIPGLNDSPEEMNDEALWLSSIDPELPLHISAFHPAYNMRNRESTSPKLIYDLASIAYEKLSHVYLGNV